MTVVLGPGCCEDSFLLLLRLENDRSSGTLVTGIVGESFVSL